MKNEPVFKIKEINQGYCRVLYETKVSNAEKAYSVWYCIQEEYKGVCEFYRCGLGPYFEPQTPAKVKQGCKVKVELPKGDTPLEIAVRDFINNNDGMEGV